jgi:hypothetical protein
MNPTEPSQTIILLIQFRTTIISLFPIIIISLHFLYLEGRPPYYLVSDLYRFTAPRDYLGEGIRQVKVTS